MLKSALICDTIYASNEIAKEAVMISKEKTRSLILEHYNKYPLMQISDLFKFLFQSSFGCEHMVTSLESAIEYIRRESERLSDEKECSEMIDLLDGEYVRVHLRCLKCGIDIETLGGLFYRSARREDDGREKLEEKLSVAKGMIQDGMLPFSIDDFDNSVLEWRELGYPAIHHSDTFRKAYNPAYRVIAKELIKEMTGIIGKI
jgi:hypothetical protein